MGASSKTYLVETAEVTYLIGDFGNKSRDIMLFSSMFYKRLVNKWKF